MVLEGSGGLGGSSVDREGMRMGGWLWFQDSGFPLWLRIRVLLCIHELSMVVFI